MFRNTKSSYGVITIILHWVMAVTIISLFGLGLYMVELTYYDAWYIGSLDLHKSIGMTLFIVFIVRVVWRIVNVVPKSADETASKMEVKAAHYAHIILYILMGLLMVSGYLISTADGRGIEVFDLINIPALGVSMTNQEDIAGNIHEILAWTLILMSALHALAALKHHFLNKNNTLKRMLTIKG
ncbi:MAG: cytochrome b [Colwellia sp.]